MTGIIYQYKIGNKYYVGKTYGLERKRIDKHKYEALTLKKDHPFCRAIRKYGKDNFIIEEIASFLRGKTFDDSIIIIDESENFNKQELLLILTRIGRNSKKTVTFNQCTYNGYDWFLFQR